ncbi:MAG: hypothetical protein ACAH95_03560 [Fimbriimonas sp.]
MTNWRMAQVVVFGLLLVLAGAFARPPQPHYQEHFSAWKPVDPDPHWDVLIIGDSRPMTAVMPKSLSQQLGGARTMSYTFAGMGFTEDYLSTAESMLDPNGRRIMIVGITPRAFTPQAFASNGFAAAKTNKPWERWVLAQLPAWSTMTRPYTMGEFRALVSDTKQAIGLKSGRPTPAQLARSYDRNAVRSANGYDRGYQKGPVNPANIDRLIERIERWKAAGIRVLGLYPSGEDPLVEVERKHMDLPAFIERFQRAGGEWVNMDGIPIQANDGVHVQLETALGFTQRLAEAINKHE